MNHAAPLTAFFIFLVPADFYHYQYYQNAQSQQYQNYVQLPDGSYQYVQPPPGDTTTAESGVLTKEQMEAAEKEREMQESLEKFNSILDRIDAQKADPSEPDPKRQKK